MFTLLLGCVNPIKVEQKSDNELYSSVVNLIDQGKWDEAIKEVEYSKSYNFDTKKVIIDYLSTKQKYHEQKENNSEIDYDSLISSINTEETYSYKNSFIDDIDSFVKSLSSEKDSAAITKQKVETNDTWKEIDEALSRKNYQEAYYVAFSNESYSDDIELQAVYNYAVAMESVEEGKDGFTRLYLSKIPLNYNGRYADIINEEKSKHKDLITNQSITEKPNPRIGMAASEVLSSTWGKPKDINKTTTVYSVSEQWVYDKGYIYLEDGIVTAIQE